MAAQEGERWWAPTAVEYGEYDPLMAGSIDGTDMKPHDQGIVRALRESYIPSTKAKGDPEATLIVAHLNHATTEDTLKDVFSKYGKIRNVRVVRDIVTGRSKGYAFIEYKHKEDADDAWQRANYVLIDDVQVLVDMEVGRILPGWVPRRLGGGFGGKKESGQLRFGGRDRQFRRPILIGSKSLRGPHQPRGEWRPTHERRRSWKDEDPRSRERSQEMEGRHKRRSQSPRRS